MSNMTIGKAFKLLFISPIMVLVKFCSVAERLANSADELAKSAENAATNFRKIAEVENESEFDEQMAAALERRKKRGLDDVEVKSVQQERSAFNTKA